MARLVILSFCFALLVSWSLQESDFDLAEEQDVTCHQPGYTCDTNCTTVYLCAGEAPGTPVEIEQCDVNIGEYCSVALQRCSFTATSCNPHGFECTGPGDFPDPFDCTVFHSCTTTQAEYVDHATQCDKGWAYNAGTDSCSSRLNDSVCIQGPVPPCYRTGETGVVPENPRMYYICVQTGGILHPRLYKCAHGFYDPESYQCVSELPKPSTTTTTVPPPNHYICNAPGIFDDPEDCHYYYVCDQYLNPHRWGCFPFTRFDERQMRVQSVLQWCWMVMLPVVLALTLYMLFLAYGVWAVFESPSSRGGTFIEIRGVGGYEAGPGAGMKKFQHLLGTHHGGLRLLRLLYGTPVGHSHLLRPSRGLTYNNLQKV